MPFAEQIETLVSLGYGQAAAQAKVAHDAVLLAMDVCGFKKHSTVKGGIVMSHVTNDIRRTTMDMDIAFVHHSISDGLDRPLRKKAELPSESAHILVRHDRRIAPRGLSRKAPLS